MKKILFAAVALVVVVATAATAEISGSISTKTVAKYVGSAGTKFYDAPVQQTDIFISLPKGFYVDFWNSMPLNGKENFGKEDDWTVGWNGKIGESGLKADIGISYYDFIGLFNSAGDTINPYAKISMDIAVTKNQTLTPYVKIEAPFPVSGSSLKGGVRTYGGIIHTWQASEKLSLSQEAYVVYDNGAYGMDSGFIGKYAAGASLKIYKSLSLDASLSATAPLTKVHDGRKTEIVPAIGLSTKF